MGLTTNPLPFNIDNKAFPTMFNFYSWRGRAKRKRGTAFLGQLQIQLQSVANATPPNNWQKGQIGVLDGSGNFSGNLISIFSLQASSSITPTNLNLSDGTNTYTDLNADGTIQGAPGGSGTINYATGAITVTGGAAAGVLVGKFSYFPGLPVMGLRDFYVTPTPPTPPSTYPVLVSFDTTYAYQINQTTPNFFYDVSYYKNSNNPVTWTGQDFQLFWTTNYQNALWATNNNPGMQFEAISMVTVGNPTTITTASPHGLVTGDYVWFNEITGADAGLLNGQAFIITKTGADTFTVAVNTTGKTINNNGIFQTLTATSPTSSGDGIRWYDGDPTGGTGLPTGTGKGWVNFAPPLTAATTAINNLPAALYYLVGALAILPYKDRLVFFYPYVQTSSGNPIPLQDTIEWSWNGTAYYNAVVPVDQTFDVTAYYIDQTGKGGFLSAGIQQAITTVNNNEDVLLVSFTNRQTRLVYTGDDLFPFALFTINSELGASATFSNITLDRGGITIGNRGIVLTTQQSSERIDLEIPDSVFQIQAMNNGVKRVNSVRDFFREWMYFAYPLNSSDWKFPTQTFLWNYRDNTWAILYENFTAHGTYRQQTKNTWTSIGQKFKSWAQWREPWNSGATSPFFPSVVAGNPGGYVLLKGQGTGESVSGTIAALASVMGNTQITATNHCVNLGDYLFISGCLGTTSINNLIGKVITIVDANNFVIDLPFPAGTYLGLGKFTRLSQPLIQTKQFPFYWDQGRQVRLGAQKYLLDRTANGQVTLNIYLSQDPDNAWNDPVNNPFVPENSLIYTQVLFTCPESTNIGLTPSNSNLQMPTASSQFQIWHRVNTSLIGDTFQVGITLSDAQMRDLTLATSEISLHGIVLTVDKGPHLS